MGIIWLVYDLIKQERDYSDLYGADSASGFRDVRRDEGGLAIDVGLVQGRW
jgi:hypothetical protein